jgi:hypothetical protein
MSDLKEMPLVELSAKDLPAFCPNPKMQRGSTHPRVFIVVTHVQEPVAALARVADTQIDASHPRN